jgi:bile acid:Na+ symporter, BASS family
LADTKGEKNKPQRMDEKRIFCICSLMIGYFVPRLLGINSAQARACAFEIGIHNSTLAMTIALTVMASF